jgi:repressor LexA
MRLGEYIKKYREEHGLSMNGFAAKSGISKQYISVLEKGVHPTTKKALCPSINMIEKAAIGMEMNFDDLFNMIDEKIAVSNNGNLVFMPVSNKTTKTVQIPVLGRVAAGSPIDAIEDIIEYIDIPDSLASHGEFFGLKIKGNSMYPRIYDGDTVIVMKADTAESGDIVIASVNESDVVCKKYIKYDKTTLLRSINPEYDEIDVTNNQDFRIIGIVIELRSQLKMI